MFGRDTGLQQFVRDAQTTIAARAGDAGKGAEGKTKGAGQQEVKVSAEAPWGELRLRLEAMKAQAVEAEDFVAAQQLKEELAALPRSLGGAGLKKYNNKANYKCKRRNWMDCWRNEGTNE